MNLEIITRCTRPEYLLSVQDSLCIQEANDIGIKIKWHIIFDTSIISSVETNLLSKINASIYYMKGTKGDMGHSLINKIFDYIDDDSWVYILDDDNIIHPNFYKTIFKNIKVTNKAGYIFSQFIGGKDFTKLEIREAKPENVKVQHIDMAQFIVKKSLINGKKFKPNTYVADGIFIEELYNENTDQFELISEVLCYYNYLQVIEKPYTLPRIVLVGSDQELTSTKTYEFESNELSVKYCNNENVIETISKFNPDCIITTGSDYRLYPALSELTYDFRQRWIHGEIVTPVLGDASYNCSMNYILSPVTDTLISIATPVYNTGEKIKRTYRSLITQTHENWEWVIVNDSTDNSTTDILSEIEKLDPRVKVYTFKEVTKGIIGESKYRAFMMTKGNYIIELDHDDYLLPHALEDTLKAFTEYPDAGFVYSDCAEIDEHYNSLTYGEGFSFGYGSYREETHLGIVFKVANTANINPLTIRHIVGVPNHLRAWKRSIYLELGGHNRRLSIADDYELIVRTFLKTRFVKIEKCCYLQFYHDSNSQNATRSDIQRRVRTISNFYNNQIKARFEEFGLEDWAFSVNNWNIAPRFGTDENAINYKIYGT